MTRTICIFALLAAFGWAAPMSAQTMKEKRCDAFGAISQYIAQLRKDGVSEADAIAQIAEVFDDPETTPVIPYLSSFVYGLDDEQLDGDVAGAMAEQCKAA